MDPIPLLVPAQVMALAELAAVEGGGYVSIAKVVPVILLLLLWTRLLTWADKDAVDAHLPRVPLNTAMMGGLILAFLLFFFLPVGFLIAFPILLLVMGGEAGVYLHLRSKQVGLGDLKDKFREWLKSRGKKKVQTTEEPNRVGLIARGGSVIPTPPKEAPDRPSFDALSAALHEPLMKNAEQIDVTPTPNGLVVRYHVEGFPYTGATVDSITGAGAVSLLKAAGGLDVNDRRKPQRGNIKLTAGPYRREYRLETAGSTAGEAARLLVDAAKTHQLMLNQLGLNPKQYHDIMTLVRARQGIVLVGAPRGQGLMSTMYGIVRAHDAFLEHIHTVERDPDTDLVGITQNRIPKSASGGDEFHKVEWVISQEPDALLMPQLEDPRTAGVVIDFAKKKMAYVGVRANSALDALEWWRKLLGDDRAAVENLKMVVSSRVLRRLCEACKVPYTPDPNTLKKLGMSADITQLFQAREQPMRDQKGNPIPCQFCEDMKFKGRTGVYETILVDDDVKAAVTAGGSQQQVKAAIRKQRGRFLLEEALTLVERGVTSVQEVMRVMKAGEGPAGARQPVSPMPAAPTARG